MEGKTIRSKMSKGEWRIDDEGRVTDSEDSTVLYTSESAFNTETNRANEFAIVSAVNNTWGKGYDPGKMQELYKALNAICYNLDAGLTVTIKPNDERHKHYLGLLQSATL